MVEIKKGTTMDGLVTNDRADYYSGITRIMVNGKNADELKGKFLDDLLNNAFSGTNGEEASDDKKGVVDEGFSDTEEANNDDEQETAEIFRTETNLFDYKTPLCIEFKEFNFLLKVDPELFTHDIERTKTYEDYENELNDELEEPWSEDEVPYEICDHICEPFRFKNRKAKWPTCNPNEDGFCKGGELPGMDEERNEGCNLFNDTARNASVCKIRRFDMIKYSFGQDEEYVAIKECECDDLTKTNKDPCRAYKEIFHSMDEGWVVTRSE
uniref:Uncharacterized protein n=1 Tax=Tanacetum cinerariifolium TaxID=118510 RepID=A0A699I5Q5_TANCI|nr:hypothetical protein [Tanacetum cinerariifolium]